MSSSDYKIDPVHFKVVSEYFNNEPDDDFGKSIMTYLNTCKWGPLAIRELYRYLTESKEIDENLINYHPIIDKDRIVKKVREYIDNYMSEQYSQYKLELDELYKRLGKRFYTIQKGNTVYLIKNTENTSQIPENIQNS